MTFGDSADYPRVRWHQWVFHSESHALTGTNFNSVGNPKFLSLGHGWSAYGHGYGHPSFSVSDDICILDGLIKEI